MNKVYSLGAVMRYLEMEFGTVLDRIEECALQIMLDNIQKEIDRMEKLKK